jgi:class 3 adenylate cyclase
MANAFSMLTPARKFSSATVGMEITEKTHIISLIKEAEVYRAQGLSAESRKTYRQALRLIKNDAQLAQNDELIESVQDKIHAVEREILEIDQAADFPEVSQEIQELIRKQFSFSRNRDIAAIEGAIALAKFGQYEEALGRFQELIKKGHLINLSKSHVSAHFSTLIQELSASYKRIRDQSIQLLRYAKDLSKSYNRMKEDDDLREKLSRYVGKNLIDRLMKSKGRFLFGNERREVTILFSDIRSFTSISESMPAEEVVSMLNEFFSAMVDITFRNNGILNKFVGDQLMAVFGIVSSGSSTPYDDAIKAALKMQEATRKLMVLRTQRNKAVFQIGIGINTGEAVLGSVGSRNRMDYTVIGDCVNVAGRLQQLAKGGQIILGEQTYLKSRGPFRMKRRGAIKLKNKAESIKCYEVVL